jgi:hypothetical protein
MGGVVKDAPLRLPVGSSASGACCRQEELASGSAPRPLEVLHDIGRVIAFCLSLALLAQLFLAASPH